MGLACVPGNLALGTTGVITIEGIFRVSGGSDPGSNRGAKSVTLWEVLSSDDDIDDSESSLSSSESSSPSLSSLMHSRLLAGY